VFAANGDAFFANPGQNRVIGSVIMALCAYDNQPLVIEAIRALPFVAKDLVGWQEVDLEEGNETKQKEIPDIQDFTAPHDAACEAGKLTYVDIPRRAIMSLQNSRIREGANVVDLDAAIVPTVMKTSATRRLRFSNLRSCMWLRTMVYLRSVSLTAAANTRSLPFEPWPCKPIRSGPLAWSY
jgi:hypothetical protein